VGANGGARGDADVGAQEGGGHGGKGGGLQGGGEDLMCGSCSAKASGIKVHLCLLCQRFFGVCMGSATYIFDIRHFLLCVPLNVRARCI
jgi:hypothetical protein